MDGSGTIREIHELYGRMKDLAFQQREVLTEGNMDRFCSLLARRKRTRQGIIDAERRWTLLATRKPSAAAGPPDDVWRTKITSIITEILHIDREIEHILSRDKKDLLLQIRGLRGGQKALQGYGARPSKIPKFVDRSE